jgi:hypothetical protein
MTLGGLSGTATCLDPHGPGFRATTMTSSSRS